MVIVECTVTSVFNTQTRAATFFKTLTHTDTEETDRPALESQLTANELMTRHKHHVARLVCQAAAHARCAAPPCYQAT